MKTIICIICTFISLNSFSQIVPKSKFVGGSVSAFYQTRAVQNWEEFGAGIRPQFGKFINEKWSWETGFNYHYQQLKIYDEFEGFLDFQSRTNTLGLSVGITRYFQISDQFYFTLGARANASNSYTETLLPDAPTASRIPLDIGIRPGLVYFITPKWMLNANFGALQYRANYNNLTTPDIYFGFEFSTFTSGIGVSYILRPRVKRVKE